VLLGARQVGKTYLLREFGREHFKNTHIFDFEQDKALANIFKQDLDAKRILRDLSLYASKPIVPGEDILIFDELQACGPALTSLKYFCENVPELHLASAGSLLGLMMNESSFPVGKVNFINLAPLTFAEFVDARGEGRLLEEVDLCFLEKRALSVAAHMRLIEIMRYYLLTGGLPEVVASCEPLKPFSLADAQRVREIQRELITAYLADMAKHCGKINSMHLERVWRNVSEQLARGLDGRSNKFTFKDVVSNIKGYERLAGAIDWLQKAQLVIKAPIIECADLPLNAYAHENTFKLYLFDVGLLSSMVQIDPFNLLSNELTTFKGYLFENFVAQELQATLNNQIYCWREKQSEVDFLIQDKEGVMPIEVKSGRNTAARSLQIFRKKYTPRRYALLSSNNLALHGQDALHYPVYLASRLVS
jgi:predicted AAA+ superfamily ATPase